MPLVRRVLVTSLVIGALGWGGHTVADNLRATPVATTGPETPLVLTNAGLTVSGGGYGHGRGMSQYGAAGAARQGLDHRKILDFYYPGTELVTRPSTISVQISADTTDDVVVLARSGLKVRQLSPRAEWVLPSQGARWRLVGLAQGKTAVARKVDGRWKRWRVVSGAAEFQAAGPLTLVLPNGATATYRSRLRSAPVSNNSKARDTVNVLSRENYLRGVVPAEMPASWPAAAVRAQAVAARTYAAHEQRQPRARHYQVCDTTQCQVYRGVAGEHPLGDAAVKASANQVLLHDGTPAFTQFSASNGGWSVAGTQSYLVAREDPYDGWSGNGVHRWKVAVSPAALRKQWPAVGQPQQIQVLSRDGQGAWGGRVRQLRLVGSAGTVTVSGDDFRFRLGLRSTYFTVSGAAKNNANTNAATNATGS